MNAKQRRLQIRSWYQTVLRRIESDKDIHHGLWWCPHITDFFDGQPRQHQGIDFNFLGVKQFHKKIFSGAVDTVILAYHNKVEEMVLAEEAIKFPWPEGLDIFVDAKDDEGYYCTIANPFNDEDRLWREARIIELYNSGDVIVNESINFDFSYDKNKNRIGLFVVIAKEFLQSADIDDFINVFRNNDQRDFVGSVCYSFDADEMKRWNNYESVNNHLQPSEIIIK